MTVCSACGSSDIENDTARGNAICINCGTVLEENTIVAEVSFGETSSGAAVLQGQFVSSEKGKTSTPTFGFGKRSDSTESREMTIQNARRRLFALATAVRLSDHHVDMAHRWYILALQHNFTRGRRMQNITAACLYIVCRQEKTPHMLLDFSDILQINVFVLGGTFLKLVRLLNLELPLIDPSLYINRFAAQLDFGSKTQQVANTALRLVSRMKRDWIVIGRRPAGICGACLLISAEMYGFKRTVKEIIGIVRMCEATIKKRLAEYSSTATSKLSFQEFHEIWLEEEADPPCFARPLKKKSEFDKFDSLSVEKKHKIDSDLNDDPKVEEDAQIEAEMEQALKDVPLEKLENLTVPSDERIELEEEIETDEEIEAMILPHEDVEFKTKMWTEINSEYLEEQAAKAAKMEESPQETQKALQKKRIKREKIKHEPAESALEAAKQMVVSKKFSKRINYSALGELFEVPMIASS